MGFWSKLGKIAKIAAPIAASFIPGVGPLASMAISGGIGGASKKLSGGSWKDALLSGGIGAGAGYLGGKIPGIKGLGPSGKPTDYIGQSVSKVAGQGGGWKDTLGKIVSGATRNIGGDDYSYRTPPFVEGEGGGDIPGGMGGGIFGGSTRGGGGWQGALGGLLNEGINRYAQSRNQPKQQQDQGGYTPSGPTQTTQDPGLSRFSRRMRRELGPVMGQENQNSPNLAMSIGQGRMDAMSDQPFRRGYDVKTVSDYDENDEPIYEYNRMPRIGPGRRRGNRGYEYQQQAAE